MMEWDTSRRGQRFSRSDTFITHHQKHKPSMPSLFPPISKTQGQSFLDEEFGKRSEEVRDRLNDEDYYEDSDASKHTLTSEILMGGSTAFMSEDDDDTTMTDKYSKEGECQSKRTTKAMEKKYAARKVPATKPLLCMFVT